MSEQPTEARLELKLDGETFRQFTTASHAKDLSVVEWLVRLGKFATGDVAAAPTEQDKTGPEIVYDLLASNNIDSISALKGAMRFFASSEGRELCDVEIELVKFNRDDDGEDYITVRGRLVP